MKVQKTAAAAYDRSIPVPKKPIQENPAAIFVRAGQEALKKHLYATIHGSGKSVEQLAFELGISPSYLYRAVLPGEAGCRFPLELLPALMSATGDYRVLEYLAAETNRVVVTMRRVKQLKALEPTVVTRLSQQFADCMVQLIQSFDAPQEDAEELLARLYRHLCDVASIRLAVRDRRQRELF